MARLVGTASPEVLLGAALASRAVQHGHVCADLRRLHAEPLLDHEENAVEDVELPSTERWCDELAKSSLVGDGSRATPLVLDSERLYLFRYADYEKRLAKAIRSRLGGAVDLDAPTLLDSLARLFPDHDEQRQAAVVSALSRFTVISGGPGTGKTTTVLRLIALLQEQARTRKRFERIILVAPTGKAAQRLGESISASLEALKTDDDVKSSIPTSAATIHRTLGYQPRSPTRFRHDAQNPLPADVVIADEASMIDLALMSKLVEAAPPHARLVLLGDKDQLASVEAGAILGDIYGGAVGEGYSRDFVDRARRLTGDTLPVQSGNAAGIGDHCIHLVKSYRYEAALGVGVLARAINDGDVSAAFEALDADAVREVELAQIESSTNLEELLAPAIREHFAALGRGSPADRLRALDEFRILCSHRRGPFGVEAANAVVERRLAADGVLRVDREHYDGRPILITKNDYQLELFNGDVGVVVGDARRGFRAHFPGKDGNLRSIPPSRLPTHETVFAMTVHKSQGSELGRVLVLLPPVGSPLLTRELVYTAVTRAKHRAVIASRRDVLAEAIGRRVERASGLRDALMRP